MRCPICDAKSTHISVKSMDHTRIHEWECNLCNEKFGTVEIYQLNDDDSTEHNAFRSATVYRYQKERSK